MESETERESFIVHSIKVGQTNLIMHGYSSDSINTTAHSMVDIRKFIL